MKSEKLKFYEALAAEIKYVSGVDIEAEYKKMKRSEYSKRYYAKKKAARIEVAKKEARREYARSYYAEKKAARIEEAKKEARREYARLYQQRARLQKKVKLMQALSILA